MNATYEIKFKNNGDVIFVNKKDKINANELMRFNTCWSGKKEDYKDVDGFFEDCNRFYQNSYSIDFYRLSDCGEQLTNF